MGSDQDHSTAMQRSNQNCPSLIQPQDQLASLIRYRSNAEAASIPGDALVCEERDMGTGCKTAMVVDDDVFLRRAIAHYLKDTGLDVLEAGTGDEALELWDPSNPVDLLVTDVLMPGQTDGLSLAREVSEHYPATRVVVASAMDIKPSQLPDRAILLPKPYMARDVARVIEKMC